MADKVTLGEMSGRRRTNMFVATLAAAWSVLAAGVCLAHGNLTMDQDKCVLRVGRYVIHFTGYQPETARTTEFCEDIPSVGKTVIVLDFVDDALRDIPVEVRVVPQDGVADEFAREPIVNIPFSTYKNGTISFTRTFAEPGRYVGLVTAGNDRRNVARFPFAVAQPMFALWQYVAICAAAAAALIAFGYYGLERRRRVQRS